MGDGDGTQELKTRPGPGTKRDGDHKLSLRPGTRGTGTESWIGVPVKQICGENVVKNGNTGSFWTGTSCGRCTDKWLHFAQNWFRFSDWRIHEI